jgi:EAL domain-containing protein (putative c-di-GMP-specific phosphodiesterase class I)
LIPLSERFGVMSELEAGALCRCAQEPARWQHEPARAALQVTLALAPRQVRDPLCADRLRGPLYAAAEPEVAPASIGLPS